MRLTVSVSVETDTESTQNTRNYYGKHSKHLKLLWKAPETTTERCEFFLAAIIMTIFKRNNMMMPLKSRIRGEE